MNRLFNALGYQITWFAAVIGAGHGRVWAGPLALLVFAIWQLGVSRNRGADLRLILLALACGLLIDTTLVQSGYARFAVPLPLEHFAPIWILSLWCAFALTLNHSLSVLKVHSLWLAAALGAVAAPLAYLGAARGWHAIEYPDTPIPALLLIGGAWAVAMPLLVYAARGWTATPRMPLRGSRESPV